MPKEDPPIEVLARAVLVEHGRVLLCRSEKGEYYYLPGGHIEFGESATAALKRELIEECNLPVRTGPLLLVSEGTFDTRKRTHHEINLAFHVERTADDPPTPVSREPDISFHWIDLAALPELDLRPDSIKAYLCTGGRPDPGTPPTAWASEIPR